MLGRNGQGMREFLNHNITTTNAVTDLGRTHPRDARTTRGSITGGHNMPINVKASAHMTPPCCKGNMVTLRASSNGTWWDWFNTTLVYNTLYLPMSWNSCPITHRLFRLWHSCHVTHTTYSGHSSHVYNTHHLFTYITHTPVHVIAFMYITDTTYTCI